MVHTVDVTTVKMHLQSVLSTVGGNYIGLDLKYFYLATPVEEYEYARIKAEYIPKEMMDNLWDLIDNRYLYIEIRKRYVWISLSWQTCKQLREGTA